MISRNFFRPIILVCCLGFIVVGATILVQTEYATARVSQGFTKLFAPQPWNTRLFISAPSST